MNNSTNARGIGPGKLGPMLRRSTTTIARTSQRFLVPAGRAVGRTITRGIDRVAAVDTSAQPGVHHVLSRPGVRQLNSASGTAMVLIGLIALGIVVQVAGVSQLRHSRDQTLLYEDFRYELANATAPIAQVDPEGNLFALGTPMAIVSIPQLGLTEVVLEGTSSRTMLSGPGHRRDTVLPGQAGASVVMGRQAAYGGPFGSIDTLAAGDTFTATTGQGASTYKVVGIRHEGDPQPAELADGEGRLTLVTASGPSFFADGVVRVDAELVSEPFVTPVPALLVGSLGDSEGPLASDDSGWLPLLLILEVAVGAVFLFTFASRRWGTWHTWVVAVPVSIIIGCTIAEQVVVLLPNLY